MQTVKLKNLPNGISEDEIYEVMLRFGEIIKVKIPTEEMRNGKIRSRGFAFVTFELTSAATKALEEGEITVEFATLEIERALKRAPVQRDNRTFEFD